MQYGFFDNQLIGVDDLNSITRKLITDGIARDPSSVEDLNDFSTDIATCGVVPSTDTALQVTVAEGVINIAPGSAYFDNGTYVTIDETESLSLPGRNGTVYVYLVSSMDEMRVYASAETEQKENINGNYYLLLAEVKNETEVTDKRYYSRGRLAYYASADVNNNVYIEEDNIQTKCPKDEEGYFVYSININADMYKYLQILDKNSFNFTRYNIKDGTYLSFGYGRNSYYDWNTDYMVVASNNSNRRVMCFIEKGDNKVTFKFKMEYSPERVIPICLRFEFIV